MRRIFVVSFMLAALVVPLQAQTPYLINTNDYQLDSVSGINSNFVFLFGSGTNAFRTAVEKGSNINFVGKSPTNATQLDYCFTNSAGSPDLSWYSNGIMNASAVASNAASMASWGGTNLITLAFGAGNTATIMRADTLLKRPMRLDVTSTPAALTFEAGWPTNEIANAFVSIAKGTNSLTLVGATIIDSGRASSTNIFPSSTNRTEVMFHKALGESKFYSIQMVP